MDRNGKEGPLKPRSLAGSVRPQAGPPRASALTAPQPPNRVEPEDQSGEPGLSDLPEYYFRVRENGAFVFRVDTENRQRRIEMDQIAVVNIKNGQIKAHGDHTLSEADMAAITDWAAARKAVLARRNIDDIHRAVDYLNQTTHWVNSTAEDDELDQVTDALLLAMHDLRSVLVRKKADRLLRAAKERMAGE